MVILYIASDLNAARVMILAGQQHGDRGMQDRGNARPHGILMINYKRNHFHSNRKTESQDGGYEYDGVAYVTQSLLILQCVLKE